MNNFFPFRSTQNEHYLMYKTDQMETVYARLSNFSSSRIQVNNGFSHGYGAILSIEFVDRIESDKFLMFFEVLVPDMLKKYLKRDLTIYDASIKLDNHPWQFYGCSIDGVEIEEYDNRYKISIHYDYAEVNTVESSKMVKMFVREHKLKQLGIS